jgi:hypothetical protein
MDMTGSMRPERDAVVEKIGDIIDRSQASFPEVSIEYGCVAYRDLDAPDSKRYELIPFGHDINSFVDQLLRCECNYGADEAEDVLGGMEWALKSMDWSNARIKLVFHIGDAPHHGPIFADSSAGGCQDTSPHLQDMPRPYSQILCDYADHHIDYYFGMVKSPEGKIKTRQMAEMFKASYDACQTRRNPLLIYDMSDFTPDALFHAVVNGLSKSVQSFLRRGRGA